MSTSTDIEIHTLRSTYCRYAHRHVIDIYTSTHTYTDVDILIDRCTYTYIQGVFSHTCACTLQPVGIRLPPGVHTHRYTRPPGAYTHRPTRRGTYRCISTRTHLVARVHAHTSRYTRTYIPGYMRGDSPSFTYVCTHQSPCMAIPTGVCIWRYTQPYAYTRTPAYTYVSLIYT